MSAGTRNPNKLLNTFRVCPVPAGDITAPAPTTSQEPQPTSTHGNPGRARGVPRRTRGSTKAPPTAQSNHTAKGAKEAANTGAVAPMVPDGTIPDLATIVQVAVQEALMAARKEQTTKSSPVDANQEEVRLLKEQLKLARAKLARTSEAAGVLKFRVCLRTLLFVGLVHKYGSIVH